MATIAPLFKKNAAGIWMIHFENVPERIFIQQDNMHLAAYGDGGPLALTYLLMIHLNHTEALEVLESILDEEEVRNSVRNTSNSFREMSSWLKFTEEERTIPVMIRLNAATLFGTGTISVTEFLIWLLINSRDFSGLYAKGFGAYNGLMGKWCAFAGISAEGKMVLTN